MRVLVDAVRCEGKGGAGNDTLIGGIGNDTISTGRLLAALDAVVNPANNQRLTFGQIAADAAKLTPPANPTLKTAAPRSNWPARMKSAPNQISAATYTQMLAKAYAAADKSAELAAFSAGSFAQRFAPTDRVLDPDAPATLAKILSPRSSVVVTW